MDSRSDLYSCGVVLFEMLTGDRPHGLERPSSIRADVPEDLDRAFERCYTRRERRFESAGEMAAFLRGASGSAASVSVDAKVRVPPAVAVGVETSKPVERRVCCPDCGKDVSARDRFCIYCGAELRAEGPVAADEATCRSCGRRVAVEDHYCIYCGTDLRRADFA